MRSERSTLNLPDGARSHQEGHGSRAWAQRRAADGATSAAQNRVRTLRWTHMWPSRASPFARRTTLQTRDLRPSTYVLVRYPWNNTGFTSYFRDKRQKLVNQNTHAANCSITQWHTLETSSFYKILKINFSLIIIVKRRSEIFKSLKCLNLRIFNAPYFKDKTSNFSFNSKQRILLYLLNSF